MPIAGEQHGVVVLSDRCENAVGGWHVRTPTAEHPTERCRILCGTPIGPEVREITDERPQFPFLDDGEPAEELDERNICAAKNRSPLVRCEYRTHSIGAWRRTAAEEINEDARIEKREVHTSPLPIRTACFTEFRALERGGCRERVPERVVARHTERTASTEEAGAPAPCELELDRSGDEPRIRTPSNRVSEGPKRSAREGNVDTGDLGWHTASS